MNDIRYVLPDGWYNVLKWVGLALLPAMGVLVATVGKAWGIPCIEQIVITIDAIGVFIATIIGYSQITATTIERDDEDER